MQRYYSTRSVAISESKAIGIANRLLRLKEECSDLVMLNDGELDFETPATLIEATREALSQHRTRYDHVLGVAELRKLICDRLLQVDGIARSPEEILVTNGSSQAIFEIFQTMIDPGDEVIIPVPCWPTYIEGVKLAGGIPILCRNTGPDIDVSALALLVTPQTKMLVINTPHNPTGAVYSLGALERIIDLAVTHDFLVLADEAYEKFVFDGHVHHSIAAVAGRHHDRVLTTKSFSKSYAMTGFRVGYVHAHRAIISRLSTLHAHMTDNVCTFAQYGAIRALETGDGVVREWIGALQERRDLVVNRVGELFPCIAPHGAFYVFPCISHLLGKTVPGAPEFCNLLLEETGVAIVPGEAFGLENHIRISFAGSPIESIARGFDRIAAFLRSKPLD